MGQLPELLIFSVLRHHGRLTEVKEVRFTLTPRLGPSHKAVFCWQRHESSLETLLSDVSGLGKMIKVVKNETDFKHCFCVLRVRLFSFPLGSRVKC